MPKYYSSWVTIEVLSKHFQLFKNPWANQNVGKEGKRPLGCVTLMHSNLKLGPNNYENCSNKSEWQWKIMM